MAETYDLANQSTNKDTKAINADIRYKIAVVRNTIMKAGVVEQTIAMYQTGFKCTLIDGELLLHDGSDGKEAQVLPYDIWQKFGKILIDKAVPTPTSVVKEDDTGSNFLKQLEADHDRLQLEESKRKALDKIVVIEPEPVDSNGVRLD